MQPEASGKRDRSPLANIQLPDACGHPDSHNGLGGPPDAFGDGVLQRLKLHGCPATELSVGVGYLQTGENPGAEEVQRSPAVDVGAVQFHVAGQDTIGATAVAGVAIAAVENLCCVLQQSVDCLGGGRCEPGTAGRAIVKNNRPFLGAVAEPVLG